MISFVSVESVRTPVTAFTVTARAAVRKIAERMLNCGVGFVVVISPADTKSVITSAELRASE